MATPMGKESSLLSVTGSSARLESSSSQDSQLLWTKEQGEEENAMLVRAFSSTAQQKKKDSSRGLELYVDWDSEIWKNSLKAMSPPASEGLLFQVNLSVCSWHTKLLPCE